MSHEGYGAVGSVFDVMQPPDGHPLQEKWWLLMSLYLDVPISVKTLDLLEQLEELELRHGNQVSNAMRVAYQEAVMNVTHNILTSVHSLDALEMLGSVWGLRMRKLMDDLFRSQHGLASFELSELYTKIESSMPYLFSVDNVKRNELLLKLEEANPQMSVGNYLAEQVDLIKHQVQLVLTPMYTQDEKTPMNNSTKRKSHNDDDAEGSSQSDIKMRRGYKKWKKEEEKALEEGVKIIGTSNWKLILENYRDNFDFARTCGDLKDKWRTMKKEKKPKSNTPSANVEATNVTPKRLELEYRDASSSRGSS